MRWIEEVKKEEKKEEPLFETCLIQPEFKSQLRVVQLTTEKYQPVKDLV